MKASRRPSATLLISVSALLLVSVLTDCHHAKQGDVFEPPAGKGPQSDWQSPFGPGATQYSTIADAAPQLAFAPVQANQLPNPTTILVSQAESGEDRVLALIYATPPDGGYVVTESIAQMDQETLESLATCNPSEGCEGTSTLVTLDDGSKALMETGSESNGILWLRGNVLFEAYGTPTVMTVGFATQVANDF